MTSDGDRTSRIDGPAADEDGAITPPGSRRVRVCAAVAAWLPVSRRSDVHLFGASLGLGSIFAALSLLGLLEGDRTPEALAFVPFVPFPELVLVASVGAVAFSLFYLDTRDGNSCPACDASFALVRTDAARTDGGREAPEDVGIEREYICTECGHETVRVGVRDG